MKWPSLPSGFRPCLCARKRFCTFKSSIYSAVFGWLPLLFLLMVVLILCYQWWAWNRKNLIDLPDRFFKDGRSNKTIIVLGKIQFAKPFQFFYQKSFIPQVEKGNTKTSLSPPNWKPTNVFSGILAFICMLPDLILQSVTLNDFGTYDSLPVCVHRAMNLSRALIKDYKWELIVNIFALINASIKLFLYLVTNNQFRWTVAYYVCKPFEKPETQPPTKGSLGWNLRNRLWTPPPSAEQRQGTLNNNRQAFRPVNDLHYQPNSLPQTARLPQFSSPETTGRKPRRPNKAANQGLSSGRGNQGPVSQPDNPALQRPYVLAGSTPQVAQPTYIYITSVWFLAPEKPEPGLHDGDCVVLFISLPTRHYTAWMFVVFPTQISFGFLEDVVLCQGGSFSSSFQDGRHGWNHLFASFVQHS